MTAEAAAAQDPQKTAGMTDLSSRAGAATSDEMEDTFASFIDIYQDEEEQDERPGFPNNIEARSPRATGAADLSSSSLDIKLGDEETEDSAAVPPITFPALNVPALPSSCDIPAFSIPHLSPLAAASSSSSSNSNSTASSTTSSASPSSAVVSSSMNAHAHPGIFPMHPHPHFIGMPHPHAHPHAHAMFGGGLAAHLQILPAPPSGSAGPWAGESRIFPSTLG
jgi:hypothetical protein